MAAMPRVQPLTRLGPGAWSCALLRRSWGVLCSHWPQKKWRRTFGIGRGWGEWFSWPALGSNGGSLKGQEHQFLLPKPAGAQELGVWLGIWGTDLRSCSTPQIKASNVRIFYMSGWVTCNWNIWLLEEKAELKVSFICGEIGVYDLMRYFARKCVSGRQFC